MPSAAAVLLLLAAAPVPAPKPGLSQEQEELFLSAEEDLVAGLRISLHEAPPSEKDRRLGLFRLAGQQFDRLAATLGGRSNKAKGRVASAAGRAWEEAGEHARALRYYEQAIWLAPNGQARADLLRSASECHAALGRAKEAARCLKLARKELNPYNYSRRADEVSP